VPKKKKHDLYPDKNIIVAPPTNPEASIVVKPTIIVPPTPAPTPEPVPEPVPVPV